MKRAIKKISAQELFEIWWKTNKWKGTQWYPIYLAEDAFKAGVRYGKRTKA